MQANFVNKSLCKVHEASIIRAKEETFAANGGSRDITDNWSQFPGLCGASKFLETAKFWLLNL